MSAKRPVLVIFGTRPEAIKLAPVIRALSDSARLAPRVCVTGQHREMLDQMLTMFGIEPHIDLAVMQPNQDLFDLTARMLTALRGALDAEPPAAVLVQGDTTSAFAGALAGFYRRIPVGHVEAGLRTGNPYNPFPEEMNRRLASSLTTWHFAPTPRAAENLRREGIPDDRISVTGNTIVDALQLVVQRLDRDPDSVLPALSADRIAGRRLVLVTGHRRESFGDGMRNICRALLTIAERYTDVLVVYPVHLNPAVQEPVREMLGHHSRIELTPPLDYLPFVDLMRRASLILTDSGGLQEEAPSFAVPVLVMRETTERPEGVEAGTSRLVGTDTATIVAAAVALLDDPQARDRLRGIRNPFGDGHAAERIVEFLEAQLR